MRLPGWAACRAVIVMAALYALALQAFLGGASFAASGGPTHIICAQAMGSDGEPSKSPVPHKHLDCCLVAHVLGAPAIPPATSAQITWPVRKADAIVWRFEVTAYPRAPPGISASARAPPAA
ncbi:hypothetical protein [Methylobacterium sp. WCS2018Hpa-22]|uniref:hypothetical protein n=1 Tax=Methylobacterium sp. WCS2018Hpa-22 TaxID=3073633 RepID=UPI00288B71AB|nr:hypothetical protein [Methylobacterium sp. WCS2018Hpa-22]